MGQVSVKGLLTLVPNQELPETWEPPVGVDAFRVTLQCVAQWADRIALWSVLNGCDGAAYDGQIPADAIERNAFIAAAWTGVLECLEREYPGYPLVGAVLWAGDREILDNHDATWASWSEIHLTQGQADALRECCGQHGLPENLFVPGQSLADLRAAAHADELA
jgi:hypothetical protein